MSRRTATAARVEQPDLLGSAAPPAAKPAAAKVDPKPKAKTELKPDAVKAKTALALVQPTPGSVLTALVAAASNPNVDPNSMRAILDMQKEIMAEMARMAFTEDFIALQRDLPVIRTDGKIEIKEKVAGQRTGPVQQSTPYATFQNIHKVVSPLLRKHNFAISFATEPTPDGSRIIVKGILEHTKGHSRTTAFPLPAEVSGSKNNVQGWGSSFSYGKRYATIALLNIVSSAKEDQDLDGNRRRTKAPATGDGGGEVIEGEVLDAQEGPPKISQAQCDKLVEAIEACGATRTQFCASWRLAKVGDLLAEHFAQAMQACKDRGNK